MDEAKEERRGVRQRSAGAPSGRNDLRQFFRKN
jgi:hypothetical protein